MFRKTVLGLGTALILAAAMAPNAASAAQNHGNKNHGHHSERHGNNNGKHHGDHHGTWNGGPRIKVGGNYTPIDLGNCYIRGERTYDPFIGWYLTKKTICR